MIIDTIENLINYVGLNPLFADVVAFLKANDLQTMEPGKYPIKGDDVFLNLQVAKQRTKDTAFLETHTRFLSPVPRPSATHRWTTSLPSSTTQRRTSRSTATRRLRTT